MLKYIWVRSLHQMATGLEYMHSMKLVHRDVKPRNVFISIKNNIAIMKWGDSDKSNFVNEKGSFEAHFGVKGTITWMAPELMGILSKEDSQPSSDAGTTGDQIINLFLCDVFAEGSVFAYFLSGGQHPFGSERQEIFKNVRGNNAVNLTSKSMFNFIL
jgi:serine/threonine protein kinase